ncbi:MAG: hypothetical protein JNM31_09110 [Flavobacteriales bacterium]|nr:hypothetical protein [Flavobacteriales bacterium]
MREMPFHPLILSVAMCTTAGLAAQVNHQLVLSQPATSQRSVIAAFQTPSGAQILLFRPGSAVVIRRFDPTGTPEWSRTFNTPWPVQRAVFTGDGADGFHLMVNGPAEFINATSTPDTLRHHFRIMHFDASGNMTWGRAYQRQEVGQIMIGSYHDNRLDLVWSAGELYVCRIGLPAGARVEAWRLNAAGDLLWARQVGELSVGPDLPVTAFEPPADRALQPHAAGAYLLLRTFTPLSHPVLISLDQSGAVQWANKYVYGTTPVVFGNVHDLTLDVSGDVVLSCGLYPAIGSGPYRYLPRISPAGGLVRADLFATGQDYTGSRIHTHASGELTLVNGDWYSVSMEHQVGILRVNALGGAATSYLHTSQQDAPYRYMDLWRMDRLEGDQLFIGGDLQKKDEIFGTFEYWPSLTQIDLAAPQYSCLLQDTMVAHYAVPLSVIIVQPQPGMTSVATDSLFTITPYAPAVITIPNVPTTGMCNLTVGMEAAVSQQVGFTLISNRIAMGEAIRLSDIAAGHLRLLDVSGRALNVRDVPAYGAFEMPTTALAPGLLLLEWISSDGLHRQVERVVLE